MWQKVSKKNKRYGQIRGRAYDAAEQFKIHKNPFKLAFDLYALGSSYRYHWQKREFLNAIQEAEYLARGTVHDQEHYDWKTHMERVEGYVLERHNKRMEQQRLRRIMKTKVK